MATQAIKDWVDRIKAELEVSGKTAAAKASQTAAPRTPQAPGAAASASPPKQS